MNLRVGFGYDIHRLVAGRPLFLGGIEIPFPKGLSGHSDGDVAAHALADALLSAAGLEDIGVHFPPGDPAWAGASGARILQETARLLHSRSLRLVQADLTVLAEEPKIVPHRQKMIEAVKSALGDGAAQISIKGRTHEGLGEIGLGEAIACYAVVLIEAETG